MAEVATKRDLDKLAKSIVNDVSSVIHDLISHVNKRFEQVDKRFGQVDYRFTELETQMAKGFAELRVEIENIHDMLDGFIKRIDDWQTEKAALEHKINQLERRIDKLERQAA